MICIYKKSLQSTFDIDLSLIYVCLVTIFGRQNLVPEFGPGFRALVPGFIPSRSCRLALLFGQTVVISQMWKLPLHFQAAPGIFTIITRPLGITRTPEVGYINSLLWHVSTGYLTTQEVRLIILLPDSPGHIMVSFMVLLIPVDGWMS